jgi:hypothetical protein
MKIETRFQERISRAPSAAIRSETPLTAAVTQATIVSSDKRDRTSGIVPTGVGGHVAPGRRRPWPTSPTQPAASRPTKPSDPTTPSCWPFSERTGVSRCARSASSRRAGMRWPSKGSTSALILSPLTSVSWALRPTTLWLVPWRAQYTREGARLTMPIARIATVATAPDASARRPRPASHSNTAATTRKKMVNAA